MRAMPIDRIEDLSPAWMAEALGAKGKIVDLNFRPIRTGQMADSFRLELVGSGDLPESVVVKMHAADELARLAGAGGPYRTESVFSA